MPEKEDSEKVIMYSYVNITLQAMPPTKPYKTLKEGGSLNKEKFLFFQKHTIVYEANLIIRKHSM